MASRPGHHPQVLVSLWLARSYRKGAGHPLDPGSWGEGWALPHPPPPAQPQERARFPAVQHGQTPSHRGE